MLSSKDISKVDRVYARYASYLVNGGSSDAADEVLVRWKGFCGRHKSEKFSGPSGLSFGIHVILTQVSWRAEGEHPSLILKYDI